MFRMSTLTPFILAVIIFATAEPAFAASGDFLNNIQGQYQNATSAWLNASLSWARNIFVGLIGLELTWSAVEIFFGNRSIDAFLGSFALRIISIGSAMTILTIAPTIVLPAIQDFTNIGANIASIGGHPVASTPDDVFMTGFNVASAMSTSTAGLDFNSFLAAIIPQSFGTLLMLLSYGLIACQLLLANIQIMIVVGGGAFLLGFLGSRWTLPFAEKYPAMVVASGIKLVVIVLIVGLGESLSAIWMKDFSAQHPAPLQYLVDGVASLIYALIAWHIPNYILAMSGASPALNFSSIVSSAFQVGSNAMKNEQKEQNSGAGSSSSQKIGRIERATKTD